MSKQNKENTSKWVKGAGIFVLVFIGIIASAGCFNWAASKPGEGAFWFFGAVNFVYWVYFGIGKWKAYRQKVRDDAAAAKAAREAELKAKWPVNKKSAVKK